MRTEEKELPATLPEDDTAFNSLIGVGKRCGRIGGFLAWLSSI